MNVPLRLNSIDLELTTKCNLKCPYCYIALADRNDIGDMSKETIEQTFDLINKYGVAFGQKASDGRYLKPTHISFYGGEPLMVFDLMKYVVTRSQERGMKLSWSVLSNGTTGDQAVANYLRVNNIWLQRSIDGCPDVQELYRPNSIGAYTEHTKIFKDFQQQRRMTVQPEAAIKIMDSMHWFESQGFCGGISPMPNFYADWSPEQKQDFVKSLWDLGKYYVEQWMKGKAFYVYYFSREMTARFIQPQNNQHWGCGGGRGLHCVSQKGYLYTCHRFANTDVTGPFCYGSLTDILNGSAKGYGEEVYKHVAQFDQGKKAWPEQCKGCVAQYGCEKGCFHSNFECTGDLNKMPDLYCLIRQESAKIVTWIDSKLRCKNPDWWTQGNTLPSVKQYLKNKGKKPATKKCKCN